MTCVQNICTPLRTNEVVQRGLDLQLRTKRAKSCLVWGTIHSLLVAILLSDVCYKCPNARSVWFSVEYVIIGLLGVAAIVCYFQYIVYIIFTSPVTVTKEQKSLLEFDETSLVVTPPNKKQDLRVEDDNYPRNTLNLLGSYSSFVDARSSLTWNYNCFTQTGFRCSPQQEKLNNSWNSSMTNNSVQNNSGNESYVSPYNKFHSQDLITDQESLEEYLNEIAKQEEHLNESSDMNQYYSPGSKNSFWNSVNTATTLLKSSLYQLSPSATPAIPNKQSGGDEGTIDYMNGNAEELQRISSEKLSHYVANLRMWISVTILQRLAREIENIDRSFLNRGYADMRIGNIGLERLKKTVENQQFVNQYMPMLPLILPFLEMSSNQEYLVERIKDLAKGSCIADYRWNTGSSYHGLQWDEHLPSDSAILFHLFCVYLDSQLMPLPQGGGRPFFSRYVVVSDKKHNVRETVNAVHNRAACAILCSNPMQPKFNFISDKEIHQCTYDRNNLFYVIIQFLLYMKKHQDSCLEGVNLGQSGINIMCVIEN